MAGKYGQEQFVIVSTIQLNIKQLTGETIVPCKGEFFYICIVRISSRKIAFLSIGHIIVDSIVNYWYDRGKTFNVRLQCNWDAGWGSSPLSCVSERAQSGVKGLWSTNQPADWILLKSDPYYQAVLWPRIKRFLQKFKKLYLGNK